jgi:hypothetical protein
LYSALYKLEHVNGSWLADQLARVEARYPEVHLVFADSRRFAEEWTNRFLTTALTRHVRPEPEPLTPFTSATGTSDLTRN